MSRLFLVSTTEIHHALFKNHRNVAEISSEPLRGEVLEWKSKFGACAQR